jgi:hypothetical protein
MAGSEGRPSLHGRPAVWREALLSLLVFIVVVAGLFHDVTLGGRTVACAPHIPFTLPSGPVGIQASGSVPFMDPYGPGWIHEANFPYVKRAFRAGELPLWNPHEAAGNPYFAGLLPGLLFPPNLLKLVGTPPLGFDLAYLARLVLAGWLLYGFLRAHRIRVLAAFAGGVTYLGCGYLVGGMHLANAAGEAMIPGVLLGLECLIVHRRPRDLLLAMVMVALVLVSGNPETAFLALAFGGVYALARTLSFPRATWAKSAQLSVAAVGLGGLLAAAQLLPFLEFVRHSAHTHDPSAHFIYLPWQTAILWIVPAFYRYAYDSMIMPSSGGFYGIATVGWVLAIAAFGSRSHRFLRRFSAIALLGIAAWYFGVPGFHLLSHAPVLNQIQLNKYVAIFLCFLPAVLAATGLHFLYEEADRRGARWLLTGGATIAALVAAFVLAWLRGWLALPGTALHLEMDDPVVPSLEFLFFLGPVVLLVGATVRWLPRFGPAARALLVILTVVEVGHHIPGGHPERRDIYRAPRFLAALEGDRRAYRIFSPDRILHPNTAAVFGLNDIRYAEALKLDRFTRLIDRGFEYRAADNYFPTPAIPIEVRAPVHILDLLGVRYFLCEGEVEAVGTLPLPGGGRADVTVDARAGDYVLAGEWTGRPGASGAIRIWRNRTETGAIARSTTIPGDGGLHTVDLALDALPRGTFANLGVRASPDRVLEIEEILWGGRRLSGWHVKTGAYLPDVVTHLDPVRVAGATPIALPALPAGADPVLVLRARSRGGSIPVALTTVQAEFLEQVECRFDPGESPGRGTFRVDLTPLRGTRAQLGIVVGGETRITRLEVIPKRFEHRGTFGRIHVYENPTALPRAFGVHRIQVESDEEAQLTAVTDLGFDARDRVILSRAPPEITLPGSPPDQAPVVTWRHESPSGALIELDVRFAAAGLLVLHDNMYPGWSAQVDGREVGIQRANYCFRAVPVPAGEHRVTFAFSPPSLWVGVWLVAGAVVAFGFLAWRWRDLFGLTPPRERAGSPADPQNRPD